MFQHLMILLTGANVFINIRAASSVLFCNKTQVLHVENSTSVCVSASSIQGALVFAKCCPLDYAYDTLTHSCKYVETNGFFENGYTDFHVGLRNCGFNAVVVDYVVEKIDLEVMMVEGTLFERGEYCLDEAYNTSLMVIRSCNKNVHVCGKGGMKCLRKCCPDLEIFVNGANCKPSVDFAFEYRNWTKGAKAVEGVFAR